VHASELGNGGPKIGCSFAMLKFQGTTLVRLLSVPWSGLVFIEGNIHMDSQTLGNLIAPLSGSHPVTLFALLHELIPRLHNWSASLMVFVGRLCPEPREFTYV